MEEVSLCLLNKKVHKLKNKFIYVVSASIIIMHMIFI